MNGTNSANILEQFQQKVWKESNPEVRAGTSVMNMEHWAQGVRRKGRPRMLAMDYGTECVWGPWRGLCNQKQYGLIEPPEYHLAQVDVPLALLSGRLPHSAVTLQCV